MLYLFTGRDVEYLAIVALDVSTNDAETIHVGAVKLPLEHITKSLLDWAACAPHERIPHEHDVLFGNVSEIHRSSVCTFNLACLVACKELHRRGKGQID